MYEGIEDIPITKCPRCGSEKIRKAGRLPSGYQRYHCRECNKKVSVLTTNKYFRVSDTQCPHCKSYHTRLAGALKDGTKRHICKECGKSFSSKTIIREEIKEICPFCGSSNLRRDGVRDGIQRYHCKDCNTTFTPGKCNKEELHARIINAYRKGEPVWALTQSFNMTEKSIRKHVKECNHKEHVKKILSTLPQQTKKDIIYFRVGAGVSYSDMTHYLKVDKEVAEEIITNYIEEAEKTGRLSCQDLERLKKRL